MNEIWLQIVHFKCFPCLKIHIFISLLSWKLRCPFPLMCIAMGSLVAMENLTWIFHSNSLNFAKWCLGVAHLTEIVFRNKGYINWVITMIHSLFDSLWDQCLKKKKTHSWKLLLISLVLKVIVKSGLVSNGKEVYM